MLPEALLALAAQCAPDVAPTTMLAIVRAESALDPYAIGVNGPPGSRPRTSSVAEAVTAARALISAGRDVDLGLAQINVRNLPRLGLSLEAAFEPCANLAAGARVLREGYGRGLAAHGAGQAALQVALSYYNTGHPGSITTVHANSAELAFEQLTLLVKESEGGRDLHRDDIRQLLVRLVDIVVHVERRGGRFRLAEVWHEPLRRHALAA